MREEYLFVLDKITSISIGHWTGWSSPGGKYCSGTEPYYWLVIHTSAHNQQLRYETKENRDNVLESIKDGIESNVLQEL